MGLGRGWDTQATARNKCFYPMALICRYGVAYYEACRLEHDYWDMVALLLAGRIKVLKDEADKRSRRDIAVRMVTF